MPSRNLSATLTNLVNVTGNGNVVFSGSPTIDSPIITTNVGLPTGNTAARPATPSAGNLRFNNELYSFEGYNGTKWGSIGGGLAPTAIKTANGYVAVANDLVRCNTAAGAFSVSFPSSPSDGDIIGVIDIAGTFNTYNLTLLSNSKTIEGDSTSVILDMNGTYVSFVYSSSTSNWKLLETPLGTGVSGILSVASGGTGANTLTGLVKANGVNAFAAATAGTDYLAPPSGTALLKANNSGSLVNASAGTDYVSPSIATTFTKPQTPSTSAETAPSTNAVTWDLTTNQIFRINLNANITTFNLTGTLSNLVGNQYEVIIRYNGGSTVSWNTDMKWTAATAPTLTGTSGKIDVLTFVVASTDGTNYYLVNTGIKLNVG